MKNRSITAKELKSLTKTDSLPRSLMEIANRLKRRTWTVKGKTVEWSGINWEKDYVSYSLIESSGENSASYRFWRCSIEDAIDCISGNLDNAITLKRTI